MYSTALLLPWFGFASLETGTNVRVGMGHMQDYTKLETDAGKGIEGVWIPPATELVYGEMKKWTDAAEVSSVRIPG